MARTKEFERDTALDGAIAMFCDHGYEGTSTEALLGNMGISRQSLYDTFGDKRQLYLEALQRYIDGNVASQVAALNATPSPLKGVEVVLLAMASKAAGAPGCMGIGATCEFGQSDAEISGLIGTSSKRLLSALERRLTEARTKGEIGKDVEPRAAAQFVKATMTGMKVAARGGATTDTLRNIARMALRSLS
ncbi:MAG: regulatory protein TetR [Bradyrhizobium sp.]|jgi:TetR/AcrR family transcriptional repressor of nem operon|nr:regulatory protein TetR [Bradyrhizobium sp.]